MLTFDKLKIVVKSTDFIDNLNLNKFQTIVQDEVVTQYRYQQTTPYILYHCCPFNISLISMNQQFYKPLHKQCVETNMFFMFMSFESFFP